MKVYTLLKGVTSNTTSPELQVPLPSSGAQFYPYLIDRKPVGGGTATFVVQGRATSTGQWATLFTFTTATGANRPSGTERLPLLPFLRVVVTLAGSPGPCDAHVVVPRQV